MIENMKCLNCGGALPHEDEFCTVTNMWDSNREEKVNHLSHYNSHPSGVECIDIVEHMTFNLGNVIKYLWRAGLKGPFDPNAQKFSRLEDLKKAKWYLDREIEKFELGKV